MALSKPAVRSNPAPKRKRNKRAAAAAAARRAAARLHASPGAMVLHSPPKKRSSRSSRSYRKRHTHGISSAAKSGVVAMMLAGHISPDDAARSLGVSKDYVHMLLRKGYKQMRHAQSSQMRR